MTYKVIFSDSIETHLLRHTKAGNMKLIKKVASLVVELEEHPRSGTGQPERLKHYQREVWSRWIDQKHRLVYEIREEELIVIAISAYGHYE